MRALKEAWRRVTFVLRRSQLERELREEMQFHLEQRAEELRSSGLSAEDATLAARREFGGELRLRESSSEVWGVGWIDRLKQDFRWAFRTLARNRGFTVAALLTLSLGIGANAAIFSVVRATLIRPLPYPASERLVWIFEIRPNFVERRTPATELTFGAWRDEARSLEAIAAFATGPSTVTGDGPPEEVATAKVSPDLFPMLGATPFRGRFFTSQEDVPGRNQVVVISHALWQRRYGGEDNVIGRQISMSNRLFTIIGVLPPGFVFSPTDRPSMVGMDARYSELWIPVSNDAAPPGEVATRFHLGVLARLEPGVSLDDAQSEIDGIARSMTGGAVSAEVASLHEELSSQVRRPALLLMLAVVLVLLIACANVAHLQLARALSRQRELAIRVAIGAGRWRVVRQLLIESIVLALGGALGGLLLAGLCLELLAGLGAADLPRYASVSLDWVVLAFTGGVAIASALAFGMVPALHAWRVNPQAGLSAAPRGDSLAPRRRLTQVLVAGEITLALVLMVCAGLMLGSLWRLQHVDAGFRTDNLLTANVKIPLPERLGDPAALDRFTARVRQSVDAMLERLREHPGVLAAEATNSLPMGGAKTFSNIFPPGHTPGAKPVAAQMRNVTPGYTTAMGIPLRRGRLFSSADRLGTPRVAIVNETAERKYFGGHAIGQTFAAGSSLDNRIEVVGVVGDVRHETLRSDPLPEVYYPLAQTTPPYVWFVIRSTGDIARLTAALRDTVAAIEPDVPVMNVSTMEERRRRSTGTSPFLVVLLAAFAAIAVLLAVIGGYGVVNYAVTRRTSEIGVRMALGASGRTILRMIIGDTLMVAALAVAVGLVLAIFASRLLSGYLFGVTSTDPATLATAGVLLIGAAAGAAYLPARRAARLDPLTALRRE